MHNAEPLILFALTLLGVGATALLISIVDLFIVKQSEETDDETS